MLILNSTIAILTRRTQLSNHVPSFILHVIQSLIEHLTAVRLAIFRQGIGATALQKEDRSLAVRNKAGDCGKCFGRGL